jgi:hypothetical protein
LSRFARVLHCHEYNRANKRAENESVEAKVKRAGNLRDKKSKHHQQVLTSPLDEPRRTEQNNDDVKTENHCKKLSLKDREVKAGDDDIGEGSQSTCWQCSKDGNTTVAPSLGILECFDHLLPLELLILKTSLVDPNSFDHEMLVFFSETLCSHGRVGHPPSNERPPDNCNASVSDEESLPGFKGTRVEECEAISKETSYDLLSSVHHIPGS